MSDEPVTKESLSIYISFIEKQLNQMNTILSLLEDIGEKLSKSDQTCGKISDQIVSSADKSNALIERIGNTAATLAASNEKSSLAILNTNEKSTTQILNGLTSGLADVKWNLKLFTITNIISYAGLIISVIFKVYGK